MSTRTRDLTGAPTAGEHYDLETPALRYAFDEAFKVRKDKVSKLLDDLGVTTPAAPARPAAKKPVPRKKARHR
jgi:hypothetical protein